MAAWVIEATDNLRRARALKMSRDRVTAFKARHPVRYAAMMVAISQRWAKAHPEEVRAKDRKRYALNPARMAAVKARAVIGAHNRRVQMYGATRGTGDERVTMRAWTAQLAVFGHRCAYCHQPSATMQRDHVIPLSRGGAHSMSNLVPACAHCNQSKNARGPLAMLKKGM